MIEIKVFYKENVYILTKHSNYYLINRHLIKNGNIFISKTTSTYTYTKHIGNIKDNNVTIYTDICNKLGITYTDSKFYLMNLFLTSKSNILKINYDRALLFDYFKNEDKLEFCISETDIPQYYIYDKIILYGIKCNTIVIDLDCISNDNILIIEDACDILIIEDAIDILHTSRRNNILNDITKYNINHVIVLHCNAEILTEFKNIDKLKSVTYYPYPISLNYNEQKLIKYEKVYDILLFGCIYCNDNTYPFRSRLYYLLKDHIDTTLKDIKIRIIEYAPHQPPEQQEFIVGDELIKLIKQSKFVICTASRYTVLLRKYIEVNYSNTYIIGNNPYLTVPTDSIIIVEPSMPDHTILSKLVNAVKNYDNLKENVTPIMGGELTYKNFYNDIMDMSFMRKYNHFME